MTKEALKLALEALEEAADAIDSWGSYASGYFQVKHDLENDISKAKSAITVIKEALAQPEQDGKCKYCTDGCPACDARKLQEQEPVAWRYRMPVEDGHFVWNYATYIDDPKDQRCEPLYTTPPQRTWVGLKDDYEIDWDGGDLKSFVKAIEAKLKEKNT